MDEALIDRAKNGDGAAMRALYERHAGQVYTVIRRIAGDDALAEDWAQDAWLRIFRSLESFRGEARFSTWAHRIAVNVALHGRRRAKRFAARVVSVERPPDASAPEDRPLLRMRLSEAVDALPTRMRSVLVLHDVEGYTHEEIGAMLGIEAGTCKSQLFKARAKLREMLEPPAYPIEGEEVCST